MSSLRGLGQIAVLGLATLISADASCKTICKFGGHNTSCNERIAWVQSHVDNWDRVVAAGPAEDKRLTCKQSRDKVLHDCPVCKQCSMEEACELHKGDLVSVLYFDKKRHLGHITGVLHNGKYEVTLKDIPIIIPSTSDVQKASPLEQHVATPPRRHAPTPPRHDAPSPPRRRSGGSGVFCNPFADPPQWCPDAVACPKCGVDPCECPSASPTHTPLPPSPLCDKKLGLNCSALVAAKYSEMSETPGGDAFRPHVFVGAVIGGVGIVGLSAMVVRKFGPKREESGYHVKHEE